MNKRRRSLTAKGRSGGKEGAGSRVAATKPLVVGRNPVSELLSHAPERIVRLLVKKGGRFDARGELLLAKAQGKCECVPVEPETLDELSGGVPHQGFVAEVKPSSPTPLKQMLKSLEGKEKSLLLAVDSVFDPHNLGAMFRAAECFGVDALMWSRNRGASQGPVVAKASAGASEIVPYIEVGNLAQGLRELKKQGYWVVATAVHPEAESVATFDWPDKTVLVLGSEGAGVSKIIRDLSDFSVYISMFGRLDSLNVAQATAVLLHQWAKTAQSVEKDASRSGSFSGPNLHGMARSQDSGEDSSE